MIGDAFWTSVIALIIGYLFGSFPTAFLLTRWTTGKDIRKLGGGNVGGLNTFKAVSKPLAIGVVVIDIAKGAAAVLISFYALHLDQPYVLMSSLGAVIGHNWMVWLKFDGGKGMGVTIGAMAVMLLVYHYRWELLMFIGILVVVLIITRNIALSSAVALIALPFIFWLFTHSGQMIVWAIVLVIILVKFLPTILRALHKDPNVKHHIKGS